MRRALLFLLLSACAAPQQAGFRDASVPVASAAGFDPARFAGRWHVIAAYPGPDCPGGTEDYARQEAGFSVTLDCGGAARSGRVELAGPGRLAPTMPGRPEAEWVLWVDADYRTAVLADPAGSGARILDRGPDLPPDRYAAALEVLRFNGFDTEALILAQPEPSPLR